MRTSHSAGKTSKAPKWVRFPHKTPAYDYSGSKLERQWAKLHGGDCEPFPAADRITRLGKRARAAAQCIEEQGGAEAASEALQNAWRAFHAGDFGAAAELGSSLGPVGAAPANKAAGVYVTYLESNADRAIAILEAAMRRGEEAVKALPDEPNAHYMLAFVMGRYSQRISIVQALAAGLAGRVRTHLERTLKLEPRHAECHVAFGLYHAEIVAKLGALAARLTYGVSEDAAVDHFEKALNLAPDAPIARIEFANALLLLDRRAHRDRASKLYQGAAQIKPADAMERLDVERAKRGLE
jgi:tetratricopeptide (TPR) repeat protein